MLAFAPWSLEDTEQSVPARFARIVRAFPERTAIGGGAWSPTFAELEAVANRHAQALLAMGARKGGPVALLLPHDATLIAAVLAVLKAGAIVIVLNPGDPAGRLAQIRADAGAEIMLSSDEHRELARAVGGQLLLFGKDAAAFPATDPALAIAADDLAFLIYTSGSSGAPKGVMQTHCNLLHNVLRYTNGLGLRADDRFVLLAALSGGQGVGVTWTALLNGATLFPFATMQHGLAGLAEFLRAQAITVYISAASVFRNLIRTLDDSARFPAVRILRLGSEPAMRGDFEAYRRHFGDGCVLVNTLSSSEAGNITQRIITRQDILTEERLPAGWPSEGIEVRLHDEHGHEAAAGAVGEIVLRSRYLSPGYWRHPTLTEERFSVAPQEPGLRTFRSGDLGRRQDDGSLMVVGRKDAQIKIHGYRVELAEIESALARLPKVQAAAVCAETSAEGDMRLIGHLQTPEPMPTRQVRAALRDLLPAHMVPAAFVFHAQLPLNPHGKIDREKLARIHPAPTPAAAGRAPTTDTEEIVASLWADIFERDEIFRDDDFFELGGDSLVAAVVTAKLHAIFGVEIELPAITQNSSVVALAKLIDTRRSEVRDRQRPPLVPASRAEPFPLSFAQERYWRFSRTATQRAGWTVPLTVVIKGPLDVEAFRQSVGYIIGRHEILRTTFEERGGKPVQIVHPGALAEMPFIDLIGSDDPRAAADKIRQEQAVQPFDLATGPLLRLILTKVAPDEHWLLRINHHIISDDWSWRVFYDELDQLYPAFRDGNAAPLPPRRPLQYGDFSAWQQGTLQPGSETYRNEIAWWKTAFGQGFAPLRFPFQRTQPKEDALAADGHRMRVLKPEAMRELTQIGREQGATYFVLGLALTAAQLTVETGRRDIVLGTYFTNRVRVELQEMFGFFVELMALPLRFSGDGTFREWVARVRQTMIETQAHMEIPFENVCEELRREKMEPPPVQMIVTAPLVAGARRIADLEFKTVFKRPLNMPWGCTISFNRTGSEDVCRAWFDARQHDPVAMEAFLERCEATLLAVTSEPDRPLREVLHRGKQPTA